MRASSRIARILYCRLIFVPLHRQAPPWRLFILLTLKIITLWNKQRKATTTKIMMNVQWASSFGLIITDMLVRSSELNIDY